MENMQSIQNTTQGTKDSPCTIACCLLSGLLGQLERESKLGEQSSKTCNDHQGLQVQCLEDAPLG